MRKFILLTLLILFSRMVQGQDISSFQDYGYPDVTLHGLKGSSVFYFRLPGRPAGTQGTMVLRLVASQALDHDHSYVTVMVNDQPVKSLKLVSDSLSIPITFNLGTNQGNTPYLKLEVRADLSITGNICNDLSNSALWLEISGLSILNLPAAITQGPQSLWGQYARLQSIVVPDHPTVAQTGQAACIYADMLSRGLVPRLYTRSGKPDSVREYLLLGPWDQVGPVPANLQSRARNGEGLICTIPSGKGANPDSVLVSPGAGNILFVTGNGDSAVQKAVDALLNPAVLQSASGNFLLIPLSSGLPDFNRETSLPVITLRNLGGNTAMVQGIGSMDNVYHFQRSDFNSDFNELDLNVEGKYSPLRANSSERGYCNVLVNGMLMITYPLNETGILHSELMISSFYLRKYNTLNLQFVYFPAQNACSTGFADFYAQVDIDRTSLQALGKAPKLDQLSFSQFPQVFYGHPLDAILSPGAGLSQAVVLGRIINQLNGSQIQEVRYPEVFSSSSYPADRWSGHGVIALLDQSDSLVRTFTDLPVRVDRNFRIYNGLNGTVLYQVSDTGNSAFAQIFYQKGSMPLLAVTPSGAWDAASLDLLSGVIGTNSPFLNSNVLVATRGQHLFFNILPGSSLVTYQGHSSRFQQFWSSYYLFVLAILLLLILLLFIYVRSKVNQSRALFEEKPAHE